MKWLTWWMRIVGGFYLFQFVGNVFLRAGPEFWIAEEVRSALPQDDPVYRLLVDTWIMFGLEVGVIGAALIWFSRRRQEASALVWVVIGLELVRGIGDDLYMIVKGYDAISLGAWILIHSVIIATGVASLRTDAEARTRVTAAPYSVPKHA